MNPQYHVSTNPNGFAEVRGPGENGPVVCFWAAPKGKNREVRTVRNHSNARAVCNSLNATRYLLDSIGAIEDTEFSQKLFNEAKNIAAKTNV